MSVQPETTRHFLHKHSLQHRFLLSKKKKPKIKVELYLNPEVIV